MKITPETMAMANKVLDYIKDHPERHDQFSWVSVEGLEQASQLREDNLCQTTMCVAGTAVFLSRPLDEFVKFDTVGTGAAVWETEGARLLGLDEDESEWLFYDASNEEALEALAAAAAGNQQEFDRVRKSFQQ